MCLFLPQLFLDQLTQTSADAITYDLIRWYGVVLFVLTVILGKALYEKDISAIKTIFVGYGLGDIIQIAVTALLAKHLGGWNFSLIFTVVFSVLLVSGRIAVLLDDKRLGFEETT